MSRLSVQKPLRNRRHLRKDIELKSVILCTLLLILVLSGCGTTSDTDTSWLDEKAEPVPEIDKTTFVTRTDTVTTVGGEQNSPPITSYSPVAVRFTVQIGSFRNSRYASAVQMHARERYRLPVVNDYNAARKLYQIRIGFFETEQHAADFLARLRTEYPKEYSDAWIVQIAK